ncbi:MAG: hypothetical protein U0798_03965 [Gemmataceae bacterium]
MNTLFPIRISLPVSLHRPATRRSRVIRSLIAAVIVLAALTLALQRSIDRSFLFHDPIFAKKVEKLQAVVRENPDRPLILVAGSSRVEVGLNANLVESRLAETGQPVPHIFNFGFAGAGQVTHSIYLERLVELGIVPDVIIFESISVLIKDVDHYAPELALISREQLFEKERKSLQKKYGGVTKRWEKRWENPWRTASPFMLYQVAPSFLSMKLAWNWDRNYDSRGWFPFAKTEIDAEIREKMSKQAESDYRIHLETFNPSGQSADCFRDYIDRCRELGIRVQIVLMPVSSEFRSWYGPGVNERYMAFLQPFNVPIADARTWVPDEGFADGHHLYLRGVTDFSTRFTDDVIAPLAAEFKR